MTYTTEITRTAAGYAATLIDSSGRRELIGVEPTISQANRIARIAIAGKQQGLTIDAEMLKSII